MNVIPNLYRRLVITALFPLVCPGCGALGDPVCAACRATLRRPVAAAPPLGVDRWVAPFAYEGVARELVARIKYRNARGVVPWLAAQMCASLHASTADGAGTTWSLVTWAPTSPSRIRERGFDPGEVLARAVARRLGLACTAVLTRRPGPPQTGRAAADRRRGPRMEARRTHARRVAGAGILLVDDVATTGATLAASAHALRSLDVRSVVALTAARTPPPPR